ncbi:hypothetical protein Ancab_004203 [Ancistrocladus abbreviatus]
MMLKMDSKVTGRSWVGNLYQKFEAICHEVDDVVSKDTVKYVENHVQTVGENVKKFYSNFMQDLLPAAVVPAKRGLSVSVSSDENHHLRDGVMLESGDEECSSNSSAEHGEECPLNANARDLVWEVNTNGAEHEECPSDANSEQLSLEANAVGSVKSYPSWKPHLSQCHVEECPPIANTELLLLEVNADVSLKNYPGCKPHLSECHFEKCHSNVNVEQLSLEVNAADSLNSYPSCKPHLSKFHVEECHSDANAEQLPSELYVADSLKNYPRCKPHLNECHSEECPPNANAAQLLLEANAADSVKNYPRFKPHLNECHDEECPANANVEQLPLEVNAADFVNNYPICKPNLSECCFEDVLRTPSYAELRSVSTDFSVPLVDGSLVNYNSGVYAEENSHENQESSSDVLGLTYPAEEDQGDPSSSNEFIDENPENVDGFLIRILPPIPLNSGSESPRKLETLHDSFADSLSDISESNKKSGSSPANFPWKEGECHILAYSNAPGYSFDTASPVLSVSDISSMLPVSQPTIFRQSCERRLSDMGPTSSSDFSLPESCGEPDSSPANFPLNEGDKLCYNIAHSNDPRSSVETANQSSGAALPILSSTRKSQNCCSSTQNLFIRFTGRPDDFCNNVEDLKMQNLQLVEKIKLDEHCVRLETNLNHAISRRVRRLSLYKKKIQDAFASRKRIEKEYKQLAIWYGDIDADFYQPTEQNAMPPSNTIHAVVKNSSSTNVVDSEWELL